MNNIFLLSHQNIDEVIDINQIFSPFSEETGIDENLEEREFSQILEAPNQILKKYNHKKNILLQEYDNIEYLLENKFKKNVLLVDDSAFNILVLKNQLKKIQNFEFCFIEAFNGQQAVDFFKENNKIPSESDNIDIIFMDCNMPIKNGYDSAYEIKTLIEKHNYQDAKICALSAYSSNEDMQKFLEFKMNYVLQKPATLNDLEKVIDQFFLL